MLVATAAEDRLSFRWHVSPFMLAARAGIGPGMTVPARYHGDEFVLLTVRNFSEPNFLGKKAFCL
jgi:hypothetical protein